MAAAANGKKEVLELLIKENASLDLRSDEDILCANGHACSEILAFGVT